MDRCRYCGHARRHHGGQGRHLAGELGRNPGTAAFRGHLARRSAGGSRFLLAGCPRPPAFDHRALALHPACQVHAGRGGRAAARPLGGRRVSRRTDRLAAGHLAVRRGRQPVPVLRRRRQRLPGRCRPGGIRRRAAVPVAAGRARSRRAAVPRAGRSELRRLLGPVPRPCRAVRARRVAARVVVRPRNGGVDLRSRPGRSDRPRGQAPVPRRRTAGRGGGRRPADRAHRPRSAAGGPGRGPHRLRGRHPAALPDRVRRIAAAAGLPGAVRTVRAAGRSAGGTGPLREPGPPARLRRSLGTGAEPRLVPPARATAPLGGLRPAGGLQRGEPGVPGFPLHRPLRRRPSGDGDRRSRQVLAGRRVADPDAEKTPQLRRLEAMPAPERRGWLGRFLATRTSCSPTEVPVL